MLLEFRTCELEMDHEAYMKYLLQHYQELGLTYSFSLSLSFLGSPLLFGKAMLIFNEESYQIVGAAGYVYGTGANAYKDQHVCQIEIAFIQREYRCTALFLQGLQALTELIRTDNPKVEQVQFWASTDHVELKRIFSKFSALPGSTQSIVNQLTLYTVELRQLDMYCQRLRRA
jgi:hypothetical protein